MMKMPGSPPRNYISGLSTPTTNPVGAVLVVAENENEFTQLLEGLKAIAFLGILTNTAEQALNRLAFITFDLAIIDMELPQADGLNLLRKIKCEYPRTYSVAVVNNDLEKMVKEAMSAGARDYIIKPLVPREVLGKVRELVLFLNEQEKVTLVARTPRGELVMNSTARRATLGSRELRLSDLQFTLLWEIGCRLGAPLDRRAITDIFRSKPNPGPVINPDSLVRSLRELVESDPDNPGVILDSDDGCRLNYLQ